MSTAPDFRSHRIAALVEDALYLLAGGSSWSEVVRRTGAAPTQLEKYLDQRRPGWRTEFTSPDRC